MNKYKVTYRGKEYTYNAESAEGAIEKFCNRKVFGKRIVFDYSIKMVDTDTRGEKWAKALTRGEDNEAEILAVIV